MKGPVCRLMAGFIEAFALGLHRREKRDGDLFQMTAKRSVLGTGGSIASLPEDQALEDLDRFRLLSRTCSE